MEKLLLSTEEVSELLGVPVATLWKWQYERNGVGPRSFKLGRNRKYAVEDVREWLSEQRAQGRHG